MKKLILFTLAIGLLLVSCKKSETTPHLSLGETMPDFTTYTASGQNVSSDDFVGKMGVIVFFDTRCPDCKTQLPEIEEMWLNYVGQLNILTISREEDSSHVSPYWKTMGYTMPFAAPGNRDIFNLFDRNSGSGVPQVFVFNAERVLIGYYNDKEVVTCRKFSELYGNLL